MVIKRDNDMYIVLLCYHDFCGHYCTMLLLDIHLSTMASEYSDLHHITVQYHNIIIIYVDTTIVFLKYLWILLVLIKVVIKWHHSTMALP